MRYIKQFHESINRPSIEYGYETITISLSNMEDYKNTKDHSISIDIWKKIKAWVSPFYNGSIISGKGWQRVETIGILKNKEDKLRDLIRQYDLKLFEAPYTRFESHYV